MYTWKIIWNEFNESLGLDVEKSFRTTDDAVEIHKLALDCDTKAFNVRVIRL